MDKRGLRTIEESVLDRFRKRASVKLLAKDIFESETEFANADLVRAFEDLEKKWRFLIRFTEEGSDWVQLTPAGAEQVGLTALIAHEARVAQPHPPKGST